MNILKVCNNINKGLLSIEIASTDPINTLYLLICYKQTMAISYKCIYDTYLSVYHKYIIFINML